jgi:hypothetical protein
MKNTASPAKSSLIFGLLFGVIMILEFVIGYVMNIDPQTNRGYGITINVLNFLILPLAFIFLGCNNFKTKLNSGFVSFGQCLKIGVTVCIIAALISAVFTSAFAMIFPEYFEQMFDKMRIIMAEKSPQLTSAQIDMAISFSKKFMNPAIAIPVSVVMYAFIGLIYSLIIGAIVKKDPNQSF